MQNVEDAPHKQMVLISFVQGLCLLYLHQAIELSYWPHNQPNWLFAFYSIALIWPVMLLLSLKSGNTLVIIKWTLPFALVIGLLGYYVGYQATPIEHVGYGGLLFGYAVTIGVAAFKALIYIQQIASGERISYSGLFLWSWRNFLTLALSLLFSLCFWLILMLWAALFSAIDVDIFKELFEEPWFLYPALTLANGFGLILFRRQTHIIDTVTRLQQALMKFLLVILAHISILFICSLPFTGLNPLWESGGSALILWMQALILFFVNAVYQDDPDQRPYARWLHRIIYLSIMLLPIYSAISFYGLSLRVEQYGWSLDRCWAYLIWLLLALFSLGYWWGIVTMRDNWLHQLSRVNVTVGLVVLGMMMLINSPLLDFRKIVTNDQLQRLVDNKTTVDDFDFNYFRYSLARPGYQGLQQIKERYGEDNPNIIVRINELYRDWDDKQASSTKEEFTAAISVLAGDPSPELYDAIYQHETKHISHVLTTKKYYLQGLDLNEDSEIEYLLAAERDSDIFLTLYFLENGTWRNIRMASESHVKNESLDKFVEAMISGKMKVVRPKWNNLEIANKEFRVLTEEQ